MATKASNGSKMPGSRTIDIIVRRPAAARNNRTGLRPDSDPVSEIRLELIKRIGASTFCGCSFVVGKCAATPTRLGLRTYDFVTISGQVHARVQIA